MNTPPHPADTLGSSEVDAPPLTWCAPLGMSYDSVALAYARRIRHELGGVAWLHQLTQSTPPRSRENHAPPSATDDPIASALRLSQRAMLLGQALNPALWVAPQPFAVVPWLTHLLAREQMPLPTPPPEDYAAQAEGIRATGNPSLLDDALTTMLLHTRAIDPTDWRPELRALPGDAETAGLCLSYGVEPLDAGTASASAVALLQPLQDAARDTGGRGVASPEPSPQPDLPALPLVAVALAFYTLRRHGWRPDLRSNAAKKTVRVEWTWGLVTAVDLCLE